VSQRSAFIPTFSNEGYLHSAARLDLIIEIAQSSQGIRVVAETNKLDRDGANLLDVTYLVGLRQAAPQGVQKGEGTELARDPVFDAEVFLDTLPQAVSKNDQRLASLLLVVLGFSGRVVVEIRIDLGKDVRLHPLALPWHGL